MAGRVGTGRRIYQASCLKRSDEHARRMREWLAEHNQTKHGVHKHSPEEFGMDADEINERFAAYRERFGFGVCIRPELTL